MIILRRGHVLGKVVLSGRQRALLIVCLAVIVAVTEIFHQPGGRIPQMHRDIERAVLLRIGSSGFRGFVDSVAFRGAGKEYGFKMNVDLRIQVEAIAQP